MGEESLSRDGTDRLAESARAMAPSADSAAGSADRRTELAADRTVLARRLSGAAPG